MTHPYLDHPAPIAFAHRGGTSRAPENTLAAFEYAVSLGYRYVETDIHLTSDGVLLAFHDPDLSRTCNDPRRISEHRWDDLQHVRVAGTEPIPRLEDLLWTWPELRINIDCKSDATVEPLAHLIRRNPSLLSRICVGSFSDARLDALRAEFGPSLCTSMGPKAVTRLVASTYLPRTAAKRDSALAAQIPVRQGPIPVATRRLIERAHRESIAVHVWTVDDPVQISRLLDAGVDGIMSDDIHALKDVMNSRGAWT